MILGADGKPLRRSVLLLDTVGIGYRCGVQLLRQTDGWYRGVKAVWLPNHDGTVHDILWASFDQDEPIPNWIRRVPRFMLATQVLTTASVSPWTVDGTWNASSNSVELVGAGGNGAQGTTGTNSSGGGGGGAGAYLKISNGALGSTVAFGFNQNAVLSRLHDTTWEGTTTNCYVATGGGDAAGTGPGLASSSNVGFGVGNRVGTPAVTFTFVANNIGQQGASSGANQGGGGGGGAGGVSGNGGGGGSTATGNGGSGGGGADNGSGVGGDSSGTVTGGAGGAGSSGAGGTGGTTTGNPGTGNSGGEGSDGSASAVNLTGGAGGAGTDFDVTHGLGGGGGGSGQCTSNTTQTSTGGAGALYGGGGGGTGGCRGTSSTRTIGVGADGVIFLTWTVAGDTLWAASWM